MATADCKAPACSDLGGLDTIVYGDFFSIIRFVFNQSRKKIDFLVLKSHNHHVRYDNKTFLSTVSTVSGTRLKVVLKHVKFASRSINDEELL
jgi:hypothetical protein